MADQRNFAKTPKGAQELAARSGALTLTQRRLLILVDGLRDVDELATLVPADFESSLRALQDGGYIAMMGMSGRTLPPRSISIPESQMTTVHEARERAAAAIVEILGPQMADLAAAIEAASSGDELRPLVREAERLIAAAHGEQAARDFIVRVRRR